MVVFDTFEDIFDAILGLGKAGLIIIVGVIIFGVLSVVASNVR